MSDANQPQLRWAAFVTNVDTEWMDDGLCHKMTDVDSWFPGSHEQVKGDEATAVCFQCPVRLKCLDYALAIEVNMDGTPVGKGSRFGIYGGLSAAARTELANAAAEDVEPLKRGRGRPRPATCKAGHDYTAENTRYDNRGWRACRTCERARAERKKKERAA